MKKPNVLHARFVEIVNRPGRYGDGRGGFGLSLNVKPMANGRMSKSWVQRIRFNGRATNVGLGRYPVVTLATARRKAIENMRAIAEGRDPLEGGIPTFAKALERVLDIQRPNWKNPKSEKQWRASLEAYAGRLMRKRVDKINTSDVLGVLTPIWNDKRETAKRVRQRIGAVMKWAVAKNYRVDNPAGDAIGAALPKDGVKRNHQRALPHAEVGAAIRKVRASDAWPATKLAFEFLVLTAMRSGEVRLARWHEFDMESGVWTIPAERMKAGRSHRVPLPARALEILNEAEEYAGRGEWVFASPTGRTLSDSTLSKLVRENGIGAVPHGFRSSFRDWCGETGQPREVAEQALAHVLKNRVEAAYARSDLFERRRKLMDGWAQYVADDTAEPVRVHG